MGYMGSFPMAVAVPTATIATLYLSETTRIKDEGGVLIAEFDTGGGNWESNKLVIGDPNA